MTLVPFNTLMNDAMVGGYAVGYFESWNLESLLAVADAAEAVRSPVILGFSGIYLPHPQRVVKDPLQVYAAMGLEVCRRIRVPACLVFNESPDFDWVTDAVRAGFGLVMYSDDRESPAARETRIAELAQLAHRGNQAVEAELFALPGVAGDRMRFDEGTPLTEPSGAAQFVRQTKIDALAVNVGQQHLHGQHEVTLNLELLAALRAAVEIPLVLHGATSVRRTDIRQAVEIGIRKVNVGSALKQAYLCALSEKCRECSKSSNPYEVIGSGLSSDVLVAGRLAMQRVVEDWMRTIGSAGPRESSREFEMMTEIIIPDVGATGGDVRILAWLVRVGDFVLAGTPLVTIETDKATEDIEAFSDGYVEAIVADAGSEVPVGSVVATLRAQQKQLDSDVESLRRGAATSAPARRQMPAAVATGLREQIAPEAARPVLASPAARRLAREKKIDLSSLSLGREGQAIHLRHVQQAISSNTINTPVAQTLATISSEYEPKEPAPPPPQLATSSKPVASNSGNHVAVNGDSSSANRSRRAIAERVSQSKSEIPHFYMSLTVDMTEANRTRAWLHEASERSSVVGPTINDLIVRAAAFALRDNPKLNAIFRNDNLENLSTIDVGIVVGTQNGVVIPIVPAVDQLDIYALAETTRALKLRALEGTLTSREMKGGALSVSNLGMYGVEQFTAIIDPAQSSILACGAIERRPAVSGDEIVARELMTVTLSVDHRLSDGIVAAEFLSGFQQYLEIPQLLITGKRSHER